MTRDRGGDAEAATEASCCRCGYWLQSTHQTSQCLFSLLPFFPVAPLPTLPLPRVPSQSSPIFLAPPSIELLPSPSPRSAAPVPLHPSEMSRPSYRPEVRMGRRTRSENSTSDDDKYPRTEQALRPWPVLIAAPVVPSPLGWSSRESHWGCRSWAWLATAAYGAAPRGRRHVASSSASFCRSAHAAPTPGVGASAPAPAPRAAVCTEPTSYSLV
jgi:hypothetical protein